MKVKTFITKIWKNNIDWTTGAVVGSRSGVAELVPIDALVNTDNIMSIMINPVNIPRVHAMLGAIYSFMHSKYDFLRRAGALKNPEIFNKYASKPLDMIFKYKERYNVILPRAAVITLISKRGLERKFIDGLAEFLRRLGWIPVIVTRYETVYQIVLRVPPEKVLNIISIVEREKDDLDRKYLGFPGIPRKYRDVLAELLVSDVLARVVRRIERKLLEEVRRFVAENGSCVVVAGESPMTDMVYVPKKYGGVAEVVVEYE